MNFQVEHYKALAKQKVQKEKADYPFILIFTIISLKLSNPASKFSMISSANLLFYSLCKADTA